MTKTHRELYCHACGRELSGGLDTFGRAGLEMCEECETALLSEEDRHYTWKQCFWCNGWSWWADYQVTCSTCGKQAL